MKKIELEIKILEIDKTIKLSISRSNDAETILENIINNPKLNIPKKNAKGATISYALWYGNHNISVDNLKLIDLAVENGDVFIMKTVLGKHVKKRNKKPWFRRFSKKQATLISIILFLIAGSALGYVYKEEIFTNKLKTKQSKIEDLNIEIEKYKKNIIKLNKNIEEEKSSKKILENQKDSLFNIIKRPFIYGIDADYYSYRNGNKLKKNNNYFYRNIRYIEINFFINQNVYATNRYEYFFISIEKDSVRLLNKRENIIANNDSTIRYTSKVEAYYKNETIKVTCPKIPIKTYRGTYSVGIYSSEGELLNYKTLWKK